MGEVEKKSTTNMRGRERERYERSYTRKREEDTDKEMKESYKRKR